jgi:hypothetical protein
MGTAMGVFDEVFHPGARQARELMEAPHEQVLPAPTPGDRLYDEHRLVITGRAQAEPRE